MTKDKRIEIAIQKYFKADKGSHDFEHTKRVLALALRIGKKEKANLKIIKLAALLHDIGRHEEDESKGKLCHAEIGAKMAGRILKKYRYNPKIITEVSRCILCHRFRKRKEPETLEACVLFDADKLDAIGAVGIGRDFLFAGEIGAKLHNSGIRLEQTKQYTEEDTAYREFMFKLRKIKDQIYTREGKRIAKERHEFMVNFFDRFTREIKGEL